VACYREAVELAAAVGDGRQGAEARRMMGTIAELQGRSGIGDLARAATALEAGGHLQRAASVRVNLGAAYYDRGDWTRAVEEYRRGSTQATRLGDLVMAATADNNIAEILSDQGHHGDALAIFTEAHATWLSTGYSIGVAVALANIGRVEVRTGDLDGAATHLREAAIMFEDMGANDFVGEVALRQAELSLASGERDGAATTLAATESLGDLGASFLVARLRLEAVVSAAGLEREACADKLQQSVAVARRARLRYQRLLTEDIRCRLDLATPRVAGWLGTNRARLGIIDTGQGCLLSPLVDRQLTGSAFTQK
jgi:tetratricopeptide (TPR) repeat protein